eukprot:SAG31_NODE_6572_length_1968_cov_2.712146_1_plen_290_part_10
MISNSSGVPVLQFGTTQALIDLLLGHEDAAGPSVLVPDLQSGCTDYPYDFNTSGVPVFKSGRRMGEVERLREELARLRPAALRRRALAAGADQTRLDDALEANEPTAALAEIIVALECARDAAGAEGGAAAATTSHAELRKLCLEELRTRAEQAGAASAALRDALDSDDPKQAVIKLVLDLKRHAVASMKEQDNDSIAMQDAAASRHRLESLKLKELRRLAEQAGMSAERLDRAMDSREPSETVIAFLSGQNAAESTVLIRSEPAMQREDAEAAAPALSAAAEESLRAGL